MESLNETKTMTMTMTTEPEAKTWFHAGSVGMFPKDAGVCVKYKSTQIAVFRFSRTDTWYACQNLCPHKQQMILSRGLIGSAADEPKVACPFHKRTFSLRSGECLNATEESIAVFPVKIENDSVYIGLPE